VSEPPRGGRTIYYEPARSYLSSWLLLGLLLIGFLADLALGGGKSHIVAWLIAVVAVVGLDTLAVHAARSLHSVTLTEDELTVGDDVVAREEIVSYSRDIPEVVKVLGRTPGTGLPRGSQGLSLHLIGGRQVVVPTRRPDALVRALAVAVDAPIVRVAVEEDMPLLAEIEERAVQIYRVAGMDLADPGWRARDIADSAVVLVAGEPPMAFVRLTMHDGLPHIDRLYVIPGDMQAGVGSALCEAACEWAIEQGYPAITVIAFADFSWNGGFFTRRGFVETDAITPSLAELRDWERALGLDNLGRRVVMRRELSS
jgi:GNAT superfamily N-acetyltransferase